MCNDLPPLKSWQFFHACRKILGDTFLTKLYNRGQRQIYRWSADPAFASDTEKNPLDRLRILLLRLSEIGREDMVCAGLRILFKDIGYEVKKTGEIQPDKDSIHDECLDDYPALTDFHHAIRGNKSTEEVHHAWQEAKKELDETWELYCKETV